MRDRTEHVHKLPTFKKGKTKTKKQKGKLMIY